MKLFQDTGEKLKKNCENKKYEFLQPEKSGSGSIFYLFT